MALIRKGGEGDGGPVLEAPEDELQCFLEESELFFGEIKAISQGKKEMIEGF